MACSPCQSWWQVRLHTAAVAVALACSGRALQAALFCGCSGGRAVACISCAKNYIFVEFPHGVFPMSELVAGVRDETQILLCCSGCGSQESILQVTTYPWSFHMACRPCQSWWQVVDGSKRAATAGVGWSCGADRAHCLCRPATIWRIAALPSH
jgi:hypothetical protein